MKVHKVTVMIVDFDEVGDDIKILMEQARYPNHCLMPNVMNIETKDIGEWDDGHDLNQTDKMSEAFEKLFSTD